MHKTINQSAVKSAAEILLLQNGQTTTLDVKNLLRQLGYFADQRTVSRWMLQVARQENWRFSMTSGYRTYTFNGDTKESLHEYREQANREQANRFWEVQVKNNHLILNSGIIGADGNFEELLLKSNRHAIRKAQNLIKSMLEKGFQKAVDKRPSLALRKTYAKYIGLKIKRCKIGFYGVAVKEQVMTKYLIDNELVSGYSILTKNAGYEFIFDISTAKEALLTALEKPEFDALKIKATGSFLTGEKVLKTTAFDESGNELTAYEIKEKSDLQNPISMIAKRAFLYNISIDFENGEKLQLSKFHLNRETELLPIAKRIIDNTK